jgi:serine/threonine protein kinase
MGNALDKTLYDNESVDVVQVQDICDNRKPGSSYSGFSLISKGGMGTVLKTTDINCGRVIAMKMVNSTDDQDESYIRFLHEAKITANLEHPNIVPVHEINYDDQDNVYFTMKYVQGDDLETVLNKLRARDPKYIEAYPLSRLLTIFMCACDGVAFAHSKGVIHRDLKPENIMIGDYGEVLIMDWGIAKILAGKESFESTKTNTEVDFLSEKINNSKGPKETRSGEVFGTPAFMAPEQVLGKNESVDVRTDIYALGGLLYTILTLQLPIIEDDVSRLFSKVLAGNITRPSDLSCSKHGELPHFHGPVAEALSAVVMKALSVAPKDRYANVKEIQNDISAFRAGYATSAEEAGRLKKFGLLLSRNAIFFMLLVFITCTAVFSFFKDRKTAQNSQTITDHYEQKLSEITIEAESNGRSLDLLRRKIFMLLDKAENLVNEGQFEDVEGIVNIIEELRPEDYRVYYIRGLVFEKKKRFKNAIDSYKMALSKSPRYKDASVALARCVKLIKGN